MPNIVSGLMLFVNIPVMWFLGRRATGACGDDMRRLDAGEMRLKPALQL